MKKIFVYGKISIVQNQLSHNLVAQNVLFCHPANFSVTIVSRLTRVETSFDLVPRVRKLNNGHSCSHFCNATPQSSKICRPSSDRQYYSHKPRGGVRSGNRGGHARKPPRPIHLFVNLSFYDWRIIFPKYEGAPSCWSHASQGICGTA
jgi:hypothetical protein